MGILTYFIGFGSARQARAADEEARDRARFDRMLRPYAPIVPQKADEQAHAIDDPERQSAATSSELQTPL